MSISRLKNSAIWLAATPSGYIEYETPDRDMLSRGRFASDIDVFKRIPWTDNSNFYWSETSFLSARVCILSAESMLQVFALNAANAEIEVTWEFGPIVHAGWVQREAFPRLKASPYPQFGTLIASAYPRSWLPANKVLLNQTVYSLYL